MTLALDKLAPNQAEQFWRLVKLYRATRSGFVAFAIYGQASDWEVIEGALRVEPSLNLHALSVPSGSIPMNDPNFLPALRAVGSERGLVMVRVDLGATDPSLVRLSGYLNLHREEFARLPHGVVFWVTEAALVVVARAAQDTYAVKRAVFDFRSSPEVRLPHGDSGLWLRDVMERPEEIQRLEALLAAERSSLNSDAAYMTRLELRLAQKLYDFGESVRALPLVDHALTVARESGDETLLAESLNLRGYVLRSLGDREGALREGEEAVRVYRKLMDVQRSEFLPDFAGSLNNLGIWYGDLGRFEEALNTTLEAVEIRRKLADAQPSAFLPDFARSLNNLGNRYGELGRLEEALKVQHESLRIIAPFYRAYPTAFMEKVKEFIQQYQNTCQQANQQPDEDLLAVFHTVLDDMASENTVQHDVP